ncbi:MAG: heme exporter protein CcmD [Methylococcales symbiont of Hymedesmia sp. n. MRB-2018]|nr:MAG: heme exporter protein CcmD [Methylococcales symbiont of Hymedesmia sp. n. MRB-2018]KAF3983196.1 MAG: heme exporter protein CcmD [Methylococcales symbiont of Hymedesmia sp. n. MRB-2018]
MNSFNEFLAMGGYGMYVWSAYGIAFVVLLLNIVLPFMQRKQLVRDLALKQKRNKQ